MAQPKVDTTTSEGMRGGLLARRRTLLGMPLALAVGGLPLATADGDGDRALLLLAEDFQKATAAEAEIFTLGLDEDDPRIEEAMDRCMVLYDQLVPLRSSTRGGLVVKIRAFAWLRYGADLDHEMPKWRKSPFFDRADEMLLSIFSDAVGRTW